METLFVLIALALFLTLVAVPWIALAKAAGARRMAEAAMEEVARLRRETHPPESVVARRVAVSPVVPPPPKADEVVAPLREAKAVSVVSDEAGPRVAGRVFPQSEPPPLPPAAPEGAEEPRAFDWERFMGVKLFAWAGGLALFLGVAFAIRWSFDHVVIPASVRAAACFLFGAGLIAGALCMNREKYAVTVKTLCATGVVILYAGAFVCHAVWRFPVFGAPETFAAMAAITAFAFTLAMRLDAGVVATLGIAGGFLTPALLATGEDNPLGLFGYMSFLNVGLLAASVRRRWDWAPALGALGSLALTLGWAGRFYETGEWWAWPAALLPLGACALTQALYTGAVWRTARGSDEAPPAFAWPALICAGSTALMVIRNLDAFPVAAPAWAPVVPFAFLLAAEAGVVATATLCRAVSRAAPVAGAGVFLTLGGWMTGRLSEATLPVALALVLAFAATHLGAALALRRFGREVAVSRSVSWTAPAAVLLTLIPAVKLAGLPPALWPAMLALDAMAIGFALISGLLWPVAAVIALTFLALGAAVTDAGVSSASGGEPWLIGCFSALFFAAGFALRRRFPEGAKDGLRTEAIPALSVLPPFLLLLLSAAKVAPADPTALFALSAGLCVMTLAAVRPLRSPSLAAAAAFGAASVSTTWHLAAFSPGAWAAPLAWHIGLALLFSVFPWIFRRDFEDRVAPWAIAALAFQAWFAVILWTLRAGAPTVFPGLIPALCAIPACAGLWATARLAAADSPTRSARLAWYAAVALGFLTAVFPIQFEHEWLTLWWAAAGAALCALWRRLPHRGLALAGVALCAIVFVRLGVDPEAVRHVRGALPVLNPTLYVYGVATAALFFAANRLAAGGDTRAPGWLRAGACWLLFVLMNLEIADAFAEPGTVARWEFSGNLARDMAYSLGWGLFAAALLIAGIARGLRAARYAAIGLMGVTLLKLFLHDLANLDQLYRIGAFMGVAALAMGISFLYQRFPSKSEGR